MKTNGSTPPVLPQEVRDEYKRLKRWPPADGITIVPTDPQPSKVGIMRHLIQLLKIVGPDQKRYVEAARKKLAEEQKHP